jgi:hypothetical protein
MSFASKPRKIKPKGQVRELKFVQSISRRGHDTLKAEEVKTPRRKATSSSRQTQSSSPMKRLKLEPHDAEPTLFDFQGPEDDEKRRTLVFHVP